MMSKVNLLLVLTLMKLQRQNGEMKVSDVTVEHKETALCMWLLLSHLNETSSQILGR